MAENIIEVLKVSSALQQTFTIAGTTEVDIATAATVRYLENVSEFTYFSRMDSVLVLGIGVHVPYAFCLGTIQFAATLAWRKDDGTSAVTAGNFTIPVANQEVPLSGGNASGLYLPFPALITSNAWGSGKARLALNITAGKISVVNNPSALSGALKVIPWIRVQHSLPMVVA